MSNELSDEEIIERILSGDKESFSLFVAKYGKLVYKTVFDITASRDDAEEITQDVFLKTINSLPTYNNQQYNFRNWMCKIAKNSAIDFFRKKRPQCFSEFSQEDGSNSIIDCLFDEDINMDEEVDRSFLIEKMNEEISKLSTAEQMVVRYYLQELNFREISEILHESENTVKSRYRRGVNKIKQGFE